MSYTHVRRSAGPISPASCGGGSSDDPGRDGRLRALRAPHASRGLELRLGVPALAARPPARARGRLRLLPCRRRHRRRAGRGAGPRAPARALARGARRGVRRPAAPSDRCRARRCHRAVRPPAHALRSGHRRRRDGPRARPLRDLGRARGILLPRGGSRRADLHRDLRVSEPLGAAVRRPSGARLPADQHPPRRGRGRVPRPHLSAACRPPALRLRGGGPAGRAQDRGFPTGDGLRVCPGRGALRARPLPPGRGGSAVARPRRGDAAHLRAASPPHHVPALRRLRPEGAAHAAGEGGPRRGGLGAAASQVLLPARRVNASGAHVAIVGGGFAGLAGAVRLARGGARVTLLERRPFLGGRAYSFTDPATGDVIDNGPHALMGAYTAALDFLGEIGAASKLAFQPRLHVTLADPALGLGAVVAPRVPGPFQAPAALLRYRLLSPGDLLRLLVGAVRLAARPVASLREHTVAAALAMAGQSAAACARFWHPLAIATLNEAPEVAAAAPFAAVLRKAFFTGARAARFAVPRVPLSELYTADAQRALERAGGTVVTGAAVATLALDPGGVEAVVLRDGTRVEADAVVLAGPVAA